MKLIGFCINDLVDSRDLVQLQMSGSCMYSYIYMYIIKFIYIYRLWHLEPWNYVSSSDHGEAISRHPAAPVQIGITILAVARTEVLPDVFSG